MHLAKALVSNSCLDFSGIVERRILSMESSSGWQNDVLDFGHRLQV